VPPLCLYKTKEESLKILLLSFIGIVFIIFFSTTIILDTPWFSDYLRGYNNELEIRNYLQTTQFITTLILASFLISQATYFITLNGESKRKLFELSFGLFVGVILIENLLTYYDRMVEFEKLMVHKPNKVKAENTILNAYDMYYMHGISIEYYDCNHTKHQYKPLSIEIELREQKIMRTEKLHKIPHYIVISFFIIIFSYSLGNILGDRKKEHNKTLEEK